jgi:hypothetical protein
MTNKANFSPGRMEASPGERDDDGYRRHCRRAERALGRAQGEPCGRQRAREGQDGGRVEPAYQSGSGRTRHRPRAEHRSGWPKGEARAGTKPAEIKAKCIETLRQVGMLLDAKAPADSSAFKGWLRQISQHVAEAATEGGFLGIGGVPVSEAEKATLAEISSALRLAA